MICFELLDELLLDEIHFDEEVHIQVVDFQVLKIYFDEHDEKHILNDELLLIWKIYFEGQLDEAHFDDNNLLDKKRQKKKNLLV
jgi:hypothetical protein